MNKKELEIFKKISSELNQLKDNEYFYALHKATLILAAFGNSGIKGIKWINKNYKCSSDIFTNACCYYFKKTDMPKKILNECMDILKEYAENVKKHAEYPEMLLF